MSNNWGFHIDDQFLDARKLTDGDVSMLTEIKNDIVKIEGMKCEAKAWFAAVAAFLLVIKITDDTKRGINDELH
jgi:hypothetical protein